MRTRENSLHLRFSDSELEYLKTQAARCGLKPQAYLRKLIYGRIIKELPPVEYQDVLKNLRQINNNLNQIAAKANSIGFIDAPKYWENYRWLQAEVGKMMEAMYS